MTIINFQQIDPFFDSLSKKRHPPVILVFGDPYIRKEIFSRIVDILSHSDSRQPGIESFQGDDIHIGTIVESLNTLSFLFPEKLILIREIPLFEKGHLSKEDILSFTAAIEKGFPAAHTVLMTVGAIDKRKTAYKIIEQAGVIIDCSLPQGSRMADIREKDRICRFIVNRKLSISGKTIQESAFKLLIDLTGYELSVVLNHIDNLVSYSGDETAITPVHVRAVVRRTKKDPVFNLNNALLERNLADSLTCLSSLLDEGLHPLQILTALVNQFRKLLFVKSVIQQKTETRQAVWQKNMDFNRFKELTLPALTAHEAELQEKIPNSDLFLASQAKNPYPLYQIFLKSDRFSLDELTGFYLLLSAMDYSLKSSSSNPDEVLTQFLIQVCVKEP